MRQFNTSSQDFILLGFSDWPLWNISSFSIPPCFFFLCHLSFLDLCYTTSIVPQLLVNLHGFDRTITKGGCVAQLFISLALGSTECVLLVVMAFACYAAVCRPFHYTTIMQPWLCLLLASISWFGGFVNSVAQRGLMMAMPLCGLCYLDHFFCEMPMPVFLKLACKDTKDTEAKMFVARVIIMVLPASLLLVSYVYLVQTVLNIKSAEGQRKAFETCGSHLMVVFLFYGSAIYTYLQPTHSYSTSHGKFAALFYTIITPMLNPFIYTLRNTDMKAALRKVIKRKRTD
uniref:G-protein coupled receptors family 1 profile domain-containing protein n=1 Tax=Monodelphis domestica TaxID=13616 RepID=A0A5F8G4G1_MONDO